MSIVAQKKPSLAETHPELAKQWSSRNGFSPYDVSPGSSKKVFWACPKGHEWVSTITSRSGSRHSGCPYCSNQKVLSGFNDLATIHPEVVQLWSPKNTLLPSQVTAKSRTKAVFVCQLGHEWRASIGHVSNGTRCPYCSGHKVLPGFNDLATTHPEIVATASPNNQLDFTQISRGSEKVGTWLCEKGHEWSAPVYSRTYGYGCAVCKGKQINIGKNDLATLRPDLVVDWAKENSFGPESVTLKSAIKVRWQCAKGHKWDAAIYSRVNGNGCYKCSSNDSIGEKQIKNFLDDIGVISETKNRKLLRPYEIDLFIESENTAIEFNGIYWHSEAAGKDKNYHANKTRLCAEKGIRLLHIWEDEWLRNPELVKRMIARKLGKSAEIRVPARKTTVVSITKDEALPFLNEHHIQGFTSGTYYLGLRHEDELVAVMVLKRTKQELRLERYATSCIVQGGFGKLIAWIQRTLDFEKIITFADLCISDGGLYENNGWTRDGELAPDYRYVVRSERVHKFNYRLKRFREDPDLLWEEGLTEKQLAELNGIPRIWDCGKIRYVLHKEKNDKTT